MRVLVLFALAATAEGLFKPNAKNDGDLFKRKSKTPAFEDDRSDVSPISAMPEFDRVPIESKEYEAVHVPDEDLHLDLGDLSPEEMEMSFIQLLGAHHRDAHESQTGTETSTAVAVVRAADDDSEMSRAKACLVCGMRAFDPTSCSAGSCGSRWCWHSDPNPATPPVGNGQLPPGSAQSNEGFTYCV